MFIDEDLELSLEFVLLFRCGRALAIRGHARHVLDDHQADLVTSLVEQVGLNLDL